MLRQTGRNRAPTKKGQTRRRQTTSLGQGRHAPVLCPVVTSFCIPGLRWHVRNQHAASARPLLCALKALHTRRINCQQPSPPRRPSCRPHPTPPATRLGTGSEADASRQAHGARVRLRVRPTRAPTTARRLLVLPGAPRLRRAETTRCDTRPAKGRAEDHRHDFRPFGGGGNSCRQTTASTLHRDFTNATEKACLIRPSSFHLPFSFQLPPLRALPPGRRKIIRLFCYSAKRCEARAPAP